MTTQFSPKLKRLCPEEYNLVTNQINILLDQRESLVKSWHSLSSTDTQNDLDTQDLALITNKPLHLGVGAPIPSNFLVSEAVRNNKALRAKLLGSKAIKLGQSRGVDQNNKPKNVNSKDESSDEELGRSNLGRLKKRKLNSHLLTLDQPKLMPDSNRRESLNEQTSNIRNLGFDSQEGAPQSSLTKIVGMPTAHEKDSLKRQDKEQKIYSENCIRKSEGDDIEKEELDSDLPETHQILNNNNEVLQSLDREARKRMKKREKRKRQKLRANISIVV